MIGNIGVGKTTLTGLLNEYFNENGIKSKDFIEIVSDNPFLKYHYEESEKPGVSVFTIAN